MPVLTATAAGVRHRKRWVFRDLDLALEPGEKAAIVGPAGSGRTTLLLALAGRFKLSAGRIDSFGTAALGWVPGVHGPEPALTVAEHLRERLLLLGLDRAVDVPAGLDPATPARDLSPYGKHLLMFAAAQLAGPALIAVDDLDAGLTADERDDLWDRLAGLDAAVVVTARETPAAGATTIEVSR